MSLPSSLRTARVMKWAPSDSCAVEKTQAARGEPLVLERFCNVSPLEAGAGRERRTAADRRRRGRRHRLRGPDPRYMTAQPRKLRIAPRGTLRGAACMPLAKTSMKSNSSMRPRAVSAGLAF
jgi:hypothetical protein